MTARMLQIAMEKEYLSKDPNDELTLFVVPDKDVPRSDDPGWDCFWNRHAVSSLVRLFPGTRRQVTSLSSLQYLVHETGSRIHVGTVPVLKENDTFGSLLLHHISSPLPSMTIDAHDLSLVSLSSTSFQTGVWLDHLPPSWKGRFSLSLSVHVPGERDAVSSSVVDDAFVFTSVSLPSLSDQKESAFTWSLLDKERDGLPVLSFRHPFSIRIVPNPLLSTDHPFVKDACPPVPKWGSPLWLSGCGFCPSSTVVHIVSGSFKTCLVVEECTSSLIKTILPPRPFHIPPILKSTSFVVESGGFSFSVDLPIVEETSTQPRLED